jgi:flagellar secretion chaperone FliS
MPTVAQPQASAHFSVASYGADDAVVPYSWDLMLLDSAAERINRARDGMESGSSREKHRLLSTAVQIVGELRSSLDVRGGDPLAANMGDLCDYICRQLLAANLQNRVATLDEVSHLLREARIAWVMLPPDARAAHVVAARE